MYMHIDVYFYMYVCTYMYIYLHIYVCTYIHTIALWPDLPAQADTVIMFLN